MVVDTADGFDDGIALGKPIGIELGLLAGEVDGVVVDTADGFDDL